MCMLQRCWNRSICKLVSTIYQSITTVGYSNGNSVDAVQQVQFRMWCCQVPSNDNYWTKTGQSGYVHIYAFMDMCNCAGWVPRFVLRHCLERFNLCIQFIKVQPHLLMIEMCCASQPTHPPACQAVPRCNSDAYLCSGAVTRHCHVHWGQSNICFKHPGGGFNVSNTQEDGYCSKGESCKFGHSNLGLVLSKGDYDFSR